MKVICKAKIDCHICVNCPHSKPHEHKETCEYECIMADEEKCSGTISEERRKKLKNLFDEKTTYTRKF